MVRNNKEYLVVPLRRFYRFNNYKNMKAILEYAYKINIDGILDSKHLFNILRGYPKNLKDVLIYFQIALKKKTYSNIALKMNRSINTVENCCARYEEYLSNPRIKDDIYKHVIWRKNEE